METDITWSRVVRVWWAFYWRMVAVGLVGLAIVGLLEFLMPMFGVPAAAGESLFWLVKYAVAIAASVAAMKLLLGKRFGDFRLVLVAAEPVTPLPAGGEQSAAV